MWYLRTIDVVVPLAFAGSAFLLFWLGSGSGAAGASAASCRLLGSGVLLVALFIATDPATLPVARRGRMLFGIGCGVLTFVFRKSGNAAMYAVLLMNLTVPWFDRYSIRTPFGRRATAKESA